jgi:cytochrome c553
MTPVRFYIFIVLTTVLLFSCTWAAYRMVPESTPVARGAAYAEVRNCVECHGDPDDPQADANDRECSNVNKFVWHPEYDVKCTDVMAYFETVRLRRNLEKRVQNNIDNSLVAGEQLARKYHCFQCHGHLGQGGFKNSKSLKGYIPGYFGKDFNLLTRNADPNSVREWITQGVDPMILENPITGRIAKFFFNRQAINMPSYKSLNPEEIEILVNYVIALHGFGPMKAETVRIYGEG